MRCFRSLRARKDIVELLVRQGRLADIQMLNFFSIQLSREVNAAPTPATAPAAAAAATAATTTTASAAEAAAPPASAESTATPNTSSASATTTDAAAVKAAAAASRKKQAWTAFHDRSHAVRRLAGGASPVAWLQEVYGGAEEWSTSALTAARAVATRAADGAATAPLQASGLATAVGVADAQAAAGGMPKSIRVVLRLDNATESAGTPTYVTASVALDQAGVVEKTLVNGMLRVRLDKAKAVPHESLSAEQVASYQHVLTSTAYSAILRKVEEVCALHATHSVRYDALLLRNPAVQMRLAQLACFRYGIDCLTDYVVGDPDAVDEDGGADAAPEFFSGLSERLHMPLIESMALNIYAERALMDGIDGMWEMVRDTPLVAAVPHRSNPAKTIDYPYLAKLLHSSKYLLTSSDGTMEEQALTFLQPLLAHGGPLSNGADGGMTAALQRVAGLTTGHGHGTAHLAAAHVNLSGMAQTLEQDVAKLLRMLSTQQDKAEPNFVISAAQYISEVLANLAVIYRCTAALNIDEEGRGHREWLLAQAFGGASAVRRQRILDDLTMSRAAAKVIRKSKDLDNYSTHPIELMNASPRKAAGSKESAGGKTSSSASS